MAKISFLLRVSRLERELEMTKVGYGPFSVKANIKTTITLVVETNKQFGSGVTVLC